MTVSAVARLMPRPPARVDSRKANACDPATGTQYFQLYFGCRPLERFTKFLNKPRMNANYDIHAGYGRGFDLWPIVFVDYSTLIPIKIFFIVAILN